ncbi:MAG TPA: ATP-binding protein [Kofleriaceae bacterium]|nr:ATP-binding protein [Kofleriaceae bacterium]
MSDELGITTSQPRRRYASGVFGAIPKPEPPEPLPPGSGLRLRTKLVIAMVLAALVPVVVVAAIATGVILSNLDQGLREDADRQLTVGLNLILRSIERFGDEAVQLSESHDLTTALQKPSPAMEAWLAREVGHVPSARLQVLDASGGLVFDRMVVGALTCDPGAVADAHRPECRAAVRFIGVGVTAGVALPDGPWARGVMLVAVGDRVVVRATSPIVDAGLVLRGVVVLSMPLDGDFADSIKGALSGDVLIGGTNGHLATTIRSSIGRRAPDIVLEDRDLQQAKRGLRIIRDVDTPSGRFTIAGTGLLSHDVAIGVVGVAVDRAPLATTKALAIRSLVIGGLAAIGFALALARFWSRRLGAPIGRLHTGAIAVSRGDLDHRIELAGGDELTDLASAFNQMTSTLKDNQARLAARMREIVALHDAGRAVSSVIDLDQVARKIVDAVARTFDVQLAALWLVDAGDLRASAVRGRDDSLAAADALRPIAARVQRERGPIRMVRADDDIVEAGIAGPIVALPLDRPNRVIGVLAVARAAGSREFSDADLNLLVTFADQAGAAVENAQLYHEVRDASEELERKVRLRTSELTAMNSELGRAIANLRETQAQLVLSERMAGLGLLVAGVAHEINSPSAAIRGSIDSLEAAVARVAAHGAELAQHAKEPRVIDAFIEEVAPILADRPLTTGLVARKAARELAGALETTGLHHVETIAGALADLGASADDAKRFVMSLGGDKQLAPKVVAALTDHVYLHRTASTVRHAVAQIQRIVGALKSYSHLDQQAIRTDADLHDGLETTLTLLHHALRDIVIERRYGVVPRVAVFVDELNQVWTNLISNAQHALAGKGTIAIETLSEPDVAIVRVIDDGPGVPADVLPRIFEPFFTTKPKGEGTGLGLGIARQIVAKHGGELRCTSRPGYTCFEVRLPIAPAEEDRS